MDIKELSKRKLQLSTDISSAVSKFYNEFVNETGISPDYININLVDNTAIGDTRRSLIVGNTDIDIRI